MENIFKMLDKNYLKIEGKFIDVIKGKNNNLWFSAKQTAEALGYKDMKQAIQQNVYREDKTQLQKISHLTDEYMGHPHTIFLTEEGMYDLLTQSKMLKARKIRKWITHVVFPSLRKYGYFNLKRKCQSERTKMTKKLTQLEKMKNQLQQDLKKEKYPKGGVVYAIDYTIDGKQIYKIGMTTDINKRKKSYDTHNLHNHQIKHMQETRCPIRLETCVRAMLYDYRYKNKKDFYVCNLEKIKNAFDACLNSMSCLDKQKGGSKTQKKRDPKNIQNTIINNIIETAKQERGVLINKIRKLNRKITRA